MTLHTVGDWQQSNADRIKEYLDPTPTLQDLEQLITHVVQEVERGTQEFDNTYKDVAAGEEFAKAETKTIVDAFNKVWLPLKECFAFIPAEEGSGKCTTEAEFLKRLLVSLTSSTCSSSHVAAQGS